ncbi:MAG TPA: hypothetical protein VD867_11010 [Burkholderiales bacterium]|nr:hypothetical protein [Burkholderiales bacterium]
MSKFKFQSGVSVLIFLGFGAALAAGCGGGQPPGECSTDADCEAGSVCEPGLAGGANVCVVGCHEDSQCGAGARCELVVCVTTPCPGQCTADAGCASDADCSPGQVCEPSGPGCGPLACVGGCHEDSQCAAGEVCNVVNCITCPCPGFCGQP